MQAQCTLCGLDCGSDPLRRAFASVERPFCCPGCMNVYAILVESGVVASGADLRETDLFKQSLALGLISSRAPELSKPPIDATIEERLYQVNGMWCAACGWVIEHSLMREPGIAVAEVSFATDLLKVRYYPQYLPSDRIARRVSALGYSVQEYTGDTDAASAEQRNLLVRLGVAAFLWLNVMSFNIAVYLGHSELIRAGVAGTLPFIAMVLATPVVFYSAHPILRIAWLALRRGSVQMETLLSIGILSAYGYSVAQAFRGEGHVYFDIACAIVTLVLLGKWIERSAKARTMRSLSCLHRMLPKKARILTRSGEERFVAVDALSAGHVFVVKAGERIPADGVVEQGESHVDESILTGESKPAEKAPGSKVAGGSVNIGGVLHVRAAIGAGDSTLAQIIAAVEHALTTRSDAEHLANRVSRAFVPVVMIVALACFIGWFVAGLPPGDAIMRAITVLVIACPCALGIATPLAIMGAVEYAASRGVLVGDGRVLDMLSRIDAVVLDKTGTLTEGDFTLLEYDAADLGKIAAIERYSEHPLGRAVVRRTADLGIALEDASDVEVLKGEGISGLVNGSRVFVGSPRFAARFDANACADAESGTVVLYGWNGLVRGKMVFGDRIRPDARDLIRTLKQRGLRTYVLSGDSRSATAPVANAVGADEYAAEILPGGKVDFIADLRKQGKIVAMIGDGINDAPALAQADLGIAMGSGADLAMRSATMVLMGARLTSVLDAFDVVSRARRVVRQNLFWAFLYNSLGIALAVTGLLNPIVAGVAMIASSAFVISNSVRLGRSGRKPQSNGTAPGRVHAADVVPIESHS